MSALDYGRNAHHRGLLKHTEDREFLKTLKGYNAEQKDSAIKTWYLSWHLSANIVPNNIEGWALQWATKENAQQVYTSLLNASYMAEAEIRTDNAKPDSYAKYQDFSSAAWIIRAKFQLD